MSNHYETLGLNENASQDEIKKKYRKLSLKHHPDRGGDQEKFKEISVAYEILGDVAKLKFNSQLIVIHGLLHFYGTAIQETK